MSVLGNIVFGPGRDPFQHMFNAPVVQQQGTVTFTPQVTPQQQRCLSGEHEAVDGRWLSDAKVCKHCRCLYVEK